MIVSIGNDPAAGAASGAASGAAATVTDGDDLTRLHVEVDGVDAAGADAALRAASLGHLDGDTAWLSVDGLREQAGGTAPDWPARFTAMLDYAAGKGWSSADGTHVQAHVQTRVKG